MKYNNIKKILRRQIENGVKTFWTYNKYEKEFTCIYKNYNDKLKIYTPQQLLNKLNEI
jgi:hypothetical protein|tara:strand:- start:978 stop:1151 length:174 start_codon:yes stop_codon:yes gene_type:complete